MNNEINIRDSVFLCSDCGFWETHGDGYIDKCPYCHSDDWIEYKKEEIDEEE